MTYYWWGVRCDNQMKCDEVRCYEVRWEEEMRCDNQMQCDCQRKYVTFRDEIR